MYELALMEKQQQQRRPIDCYRANSDDDDEVDDEHESSDDEHEAAVAAQYQVSCLPCNIRLPATAQQSSQAAQSAASATATSSPRCQDMKLALRQQQQQQSRQSSSSAAAKAKQLELKMTEDSVTTPITSFRAAHPTNAGSLLGSLPRQLQQGQHEKQHDHHRDHHLHHHHQHRQQQHYQHQLDQLQQQFPLSATSVAASYLHHKMPSNNQEVHSSKLPALPQVPPTGATASTGNAGCNQLRCYLCDTPKHEYSLIRTFSEIICRGCLNYEGPDRVEQLLLNARRSKNAAQQLHQQPPPLVYLSGGTGAELQARQVIGGVYEPPVALNRQQLRQLQSQPHPQLRRISNSSNSYPMQLIPNSRAHFSGNPQQQQESPFISELVAMNEQQQQSQSLLDKRAASYFRESSSRLQDSRQSGISQPDPKRRADQNRIPQSSPVASAERAAQPFEYTVSSSPEVISGDSKSPSSGSESRTLPGSNTSSETATSATSTAISKQAKQLPPVAPQSSGAGVSLLQQQLQSEQNQHLSSAVGPSLLPPPPPLYNHHHQFSGSRSSSPLPVPLPQIPTPAQQANHHHHHHNHLQQRLHYPSVTALTAQQFAPQAPPTFISMRRHPFGGESPQMNHQHQHQQQQQQQHQHNLDLLNNARQVEARELFAQDQQARLTLAARAKLPASIHYPAPYLAQPHQHLHQHQHQPQAQYFVPTNTLRNGSATTATYSALPSGPHLLPVDPATALNLAAAQSQEVAARQRLLVSSARKQPEMSDDLRRFGIIHSDSQRLDDGRPSPPTPPPQQPSINSQVNGERKDSEEVIFDANNKQNTAAVAANRRSPEQSPVAYLEKPNQADPRTTGNQTATAKGGSQQLQSKVSSKKAVYRLSPLSPSIVAPTAKRVSFRKTPPKESRLKRSLATSGAQVSAQPKFSSPPLDPYHYDPSPPPPALQPPTNQQPLSPPSAQLPVSNNTSSSPVAAPPLSATNASTANRRSSPGVKVRSHDQLFATNINKSSSATTNHHHTNNNKHKSSAGNNQQGNTQMLNSLVVEQLRCLLCRDRLDDRHFVQCPSDLQHRFCFTCSKISIQRQRDENRDSKVFCPSGKKCLLASERSPWTFMNNEIETIFRESNIHNANLESLIATPHRNNNSNNNSKQQSDLNEKSRSRSTPDSKSLETASSMVTLDQQVAANSSVTNKSLNHLPAAYENNNSLSAKINASPGK